jgi:transcriptional regulator of acetoin/glycerol metabolism
MIAAVRFKQPHIYSEGWYVKETLPNLSGSKTVFPEQLERHGWNVAATARAIDTPRSNLYKKLQAYGISREET